MGRAVAVAGLLGMVIGCESPAVSFEPKVSAELSEGCSPPCVNGFECHPGVRECVPAIQRSCEGDGVCGLEVSAGDVCEVPGSYVPCGEANDCRFGCRVCLQTGWSGCRITLERCTNDADGDGNCDEIDGCNDRDQDGAGDGTNGNRDCLSFVSDSDDANASLCTDVDGDGCDDCSVLNRFDPDRDGTDVDSDGTCDQVDGCIDDDGDGLGVGDDCVDTTPDLREGEALICNDTDQDGCDDCSSGRFAPLFDGVDLDGDGACSVGDPDDDNDGVPDNEDVSPNDAGRCADADGDGCDDCSQGVDGMGPLADADPENDGLDGDGDGICALTDCNDASAAALPGGIEDRSTAGRCSDGIDNDCDGRIDLADEGCWYEDFAYRRTITLDDSDVSGTLADFPVLVRIVDPTLASQMDSTASDVVLITEDHATRIPVEIDRFDSDRGELDFWFRWTLPATDSPETFFLYSGSPRSIASNASQVWDDAYLGVYHLTRPSSAAGLTSQPDSTPRNADLQVAGASTLNAFDDGQAGDALFFNGSTTTAVTPDLLNDLGDDEFTVSMWVRPLTDDATFLVETDTANFSNIKIDLLTLAPVLGDPRFAIEAESFPAYLADGPVVGFQGDWHWVALRHRAGLDRLELWVNGRQEASIPGVLPTRRANGTPFRFALGRGGDLSLPFRGEIDEFRVSRGARSDDWLSAEYTAIVSPFAVAGPPESRP